MIYKIESPYYKLIQILIIHILDITIGLSLKFNNKNFIFYGSYKTNPIPNNKKVIILLT